MAPATETAAQGAERGANSLSRWVEANQKLAVALGLTTIAVGGAGVYYYLNGSPASRPSSRSSKGGEDAAAGLDEKAAGSSGNAASKKKKSKKSKRTKEGSSTADSLPRDPDGPLLDEASDQDLMTLSEEEIKRLADDVRERSNQFAMFAAR
jgi:import receptor subunit TOM70